VEQRSRSDVAVPMGNLRAEYDSLRPAIDDAIRRILEGGKFVFGDELDAFEEEFARYLGARHAIGVGSGTAALHLALTACGLSPGDEVVTVPNTDTPTTMAVTHAGGSIVWADTDERTFNLDPAHLEERITEKTRVILPVHLFGHPADMTPIMDLAHRNDIVVIEDAALALGSEYNGRKVGAIGHIGCFSLAPSKILGAFGDAGIVVTDDSDIAERVRVLRNYGHAPDMKVDERDPLGPPVWRVLEEGYNERLDTLQAAVLRAKLPTLDERIDKRRRAAHRYNELLAESVVVTPYEASYAKHVYFAYAVLIDNRDEARDFLAARGIATRLYYNPPLHLQPAYRRFDRGPGSFPVTESTAARMLALPVFPQITDGQIELAASALVEFADGSRRRNVGA
jgi:dTDP-4-amino-4,6-dideoxygalactose transaminase